MIPGDSVIRLWFLHSARMEQRRRKRQRGNPASGSILHIYLFACHGRIAYQIFAVQIFLVQLHCRNAVIVIGLIIVNPLLQIAAGAVYGNLIFSLAQIAASSLLLHGS